MNMNKAQKAEEAVLGSILLDSSTLSLAREQLTITDFFSEQNRRLYKTMMDLDNAGAPIDIATISPALIDDPTFNDDGGIVVYLQSLESMLPSPVAIPIYIKTVKNDSKRRKLLALAKDIESKASQYIQDVEPLTSSIAEAVAEISAEGVKPWIDVKEAIKTSLLDAQELAVAGGEIPGIRTGFIDLDKKLSGLRPGSLSIVAARPAMGKTAFALNIMVYAAIEMKKKVAFFSLEMSSSELASRVLSQMTSIDSGNLKRGLLDKNDWNRLLCTAKDYKDASIQIDETAAIDIATLRDRAKRMQADGGLDLIIIDYLQLMRSTSKRIGNREQEIADISRGLKALAKELKLPVIALAQLNRAVDARPDKRPFLSDLRESGSVEQDADNVLFIHREEYYTPKPENANLAEIIIAKQRSGPTGTVKLFWDGRFTRFANLANDDERF